jgi:hypothetical protein
MQSGARSSRALRHFVGRYLEQWPVCWSCRLGVRASTSWNRICISVSAYPCWRHYFLVVCDRLFTERSRNGGVVGRAYRVCATTREGLPLVILLLSDSADSKGLLLHLSSTKRAKFNRGYSAPGAFFLDAEQSVTLARSLSRLVAPDPSRTIGFVAITKPYTLIQRRKTLVQPGRISPTLRFA